MRRFRSVSVRLSQIRRFTSPAFPHIHIHKQGSSQCAISYLPTEPKESSRAIVGWSPCTASDVDLSKPSKVRFNPSFITALNEVCANHAHDDPILQAMAATQDSGHLHVADEKNPPPYGRIPYPEDIIGTIRIEHGKLVPGTYTPMKEAYRPVSGEGVVKLSQYLEDKLLAMLKREEGK